MSPQQSIGSGSEPDPIADPASSARTNTSISALVASARSAHPQRTHVPVHASAPETQLSAGNDGGVNAPVASAHGPSAPKPKPRRSASGAGAGQGNKAKFSSSGKVNTSARKPTDAAPAKAASKGSSVRNKKNSSSNGPAATKGTASGVEESAAEAGQPEAPTSSGRVAWDSDAGGPGQQTSLDVLLEWLSDPDNYARLKGKDGCTRVSCCAEISGLIAQAGTKASRSVACISDKITRVVTQFNELELWLSETGQGLLDTAQAEPESKRPEAVAAAETSIKRWIEKTCPFYETLLPVLKDRASVRPGISFGTGDTDDVAVDLLRARKELQYDAFEPGEMPLSGWDQTQSDQSQRDAASASTAAPTTAAASSTSSASGQPDQTKSTDPSPSASGTALEATKTPQTKEMPLAGATSGSGRVIGGGTKPTKTKRMSAFESNFDARGDKRLRVDAKAKDFEMKTLAFEKVTNRASNLASVGGMSRKEAFATASQEFQTFMSSTGFSLLDDGEEEATGDARRAGSREKKPRKSKGKARAIDSDESEGGISAQLLGDDDDDYEDLELD
ncbi:hypothetical protein V8E36_003649 [Tilletia maclaganii]